VLSPVTDEICAGRLCKGRARRSPSKSRRDRDSRIRTSGAGWVFGAAIAVAGLLPGLSCGIKAPPQPRELVVPAPIEDVAVRVVPEGLRITFTLPSKSLDGSPLETIGGYRILREGPDGKEVREETRFSVSEMRQRRGKSMAFLDEIPEQAGVYRYCVIPLDVYGSHPSRSQMRPFCWEGYFSEKKQEGQRNE